MPRAAVFLLLVRLATTSLTTKDAPPVVIPNDNLYLDNPSGAVASLSSPTKYLTSSVFGEDSSSDNVRQLVWGEAEIIQQAGKQLGRRQRNH